MMDRKELRTKDSASIGEVHSLTLAMCDKADDHAGVRAVLCKQ